MDIYTENVFLVAIVFFFPWWLDYLLVKLLFLLRLHDVPLLRANSSLVVSCYLTYEPVSSGCPGFVC